MAVISRHFSFGAPGRARSLGGESIIGVQHQVIRQPVQVQGEEQRGVEAVGADAAGLLNPAVQRPAKSGGELLPDQLYAPDEKPHGICSTGKRAAPPEGNHGIQTL